MDALKVIASAFLQGFYDSIKGCVLVFSIDRQMRIQMQESKSIEKSDASNITEREKTQSRNKKNEPKIMRQVWKCCMLNGGCTWFVIFIFQYGVLNVIKFLINDEVVWKWLSSILSIVFGMAYVMPIFILSKIVNGLWFQDIADSVYKFRKGRPQLIPSFSKLIADFIFSLFVQMLFLCQSTLVSYLPFQYVGLTLCYVHLAFLYALYSFEYKWVNMGWELHKRLNFIECNWPYFLGFGMPLTILTNITSSFVLSGCIFSMAFPIFILSATDAQPITGSCDFPLKLFSPVVAISNLLINQSVKVQKTANINSNSQNLTNLKLNHHERSNTPEILERREYDRRNSRTLSHRSFR
ncbi:etoposide-induced protein 2.4 homolog [Condylostylus longicornis]|uniref:etoposide-induced protein 2.4 homolog n=1 Tax=Condylostylus longicornis TaxID=2530218 RepID=UPI00244D9FE3|nr:etoposide-induced protein 2.4 homolog [Condylostylus longicornis]